MSTKRNSGHTNILVYSAAGGNLGDTAIFLSLANQLQSLPNVQITLATPYTNRDSFETVINRVTTLNQLESFYLGASWLKDNVANARTTLAAIHKADIVIIGGGGLVNDQFGFGWLSQWLFPAYYASQIGKKVLLLGVGAGPLRTTSSRLAVRIGLQYVRAITVRDEFSYNTLLRVGIPQRLLTVTADPVFGLCLREADRSERQAKTIAVIPRLDDPSGRWQAKWWIEFAKSVGTFCRSNVAIVALCDYDYQELVKVPANGSDFHLANASRMRSWEVLMEQTSCVLSSRMHGCIMAALSSVPVVALNTYDPKVASLSKLLELPILQLEPARGAPPTAVDAIRQAHLRRTRVMQCIDAQRAKLEMHRSLVSAAI